MVDPPRMVAECRTRKLGAAWTARKLISVMIAQASLSRGATPFHHQGTHLEVPPVVNQIVAGPLGVSGRGI